jgi:hypothetical protein
MIESYDAAIRILDRALEVRTWSGKNALELRGLMSELDDDSQQEIRLRLVRAMNEGQMEFVGHPNEWFL